MDAFIGEIRIFPFGYIPQGWFACNGAEYNANQQPALYSIIGNTWGGTPNQTFKVPNLAGFCVMGQGTGPGLSPRPWGAATVGAKTATLSPAQLPTHTHTLTIQGAVPAQALANTTTTPTANQSWLARPVQPNSTGANAVPAYTKVTPPNTTLHPSTIAYACGGAGGAASPHENRQPYLTMVFAINVDGIYPVRN